MALATTKQLDFIKALLGKQIENLKQMIEGIEAGKIKQYAGLGLAEFEVTLDFLNRVQVDALMLETYEASALIESLKTNAFDVELRDFAAAFAAGKFTLTAQQAARRNERLETDEFHEGDNLYTLQQVFVKLALSIPAPEMTEAQLDDIAWDTAPSTPTQDGTRARWQVLSFDTIPSIVRFDIMLPDGSIADGWTRYQEVSPEWKASGIAKTLLSEYESADHTRRGEYLNVNWTTRHELAQVLTVSEVSVRYGISESAVRMSIQRNPSGELRQSGSTWLIHEREAALRWGNKDVRAFINIDERYGGAEPANLQDYYDLAAGFGNGNFFEKGGAGIYEIAHDGSRTLVAIPKKLED